MSRGPENRFRESIHRKLPKQIHHEKMNNPFRGGTFDDWYSGRHADIWVEWKYDQTGKAKPNLSELQKRWGRERFAEGRRVFVLVGDPFGGRLFKLPSQWEAGVGADRLTKEEIVAWLVEQTLGTEKDASKTETVRRRTRNGEHLQDPPDRDPRG